MEYDKSTTGRIIKKEREKRKLTQNQLAELIRISCKQISKYEKGELLPPMNMLIALCKVFDCEIGYLLGEEDYTDGSKLDTVIHEKLGLTVESIEALKRITGSGRKSLEFGYCSEEYRGILNRFLTSSHFISIMERMMEIERCQKELDKCQAEFDSAYSDEIREQAWEAKFGPIDYEHDLDAPQLDPDVISAYNAIDKLLDDQENKNYRMRINRFELIAAFTELVSELYPIGESNSCRKKVRVDDR